MENAFLHIHGIACAYHIGAAKHAQQLQHLHCGMKNEHGSFPLHVWVCEELQCFPIVPNLPTRRCICRLDCMPDSSIFSLKHRMPAPVIPPPRTSLSNHIHGNLPPSFFCNYPSAHVSLCSPLPCFHPSLFLCTTSTPSMPVDDIPFLGEETPMRGRHRATVPFERRDVSRWR